MRETAKAQAELAAVQNRNSELSASVEELKTNEGIEDRATSEFGYVKDGEGAATVTGIEKKEANSVTPSINSDDISAPEVWYSPALDTIFGYSG